MKIETHNCPLCGNEVLHRAIYPNQVCPRCRDKASDAYGRRLRFSHDSASDGYRAFYRDRETEYRHQICYIDGRKCFARADRFSGIIVEIVENQL